MREKVARAICVRLHNNPDAPAPSAQGETVQPYWTLFESVAETAIQAMREPTVDMLIDSLEKTKPEDFIDNQANYSIKVWQAMIDCALKEGK